MPKSVCPKYRVQFYNMKSHHRGEFLIKSIKELSDKLNYPYQQLTNKINQNVTTTYNNIPIIIYISKLPRQQFLYYQSLNKRQHNENNYGKYKD